MSSSSDRDSGEWRRYSVAPVGDAISWSPSKGGWARSSVRPDATWGSFEVVRCGCCEVVVDGGAFPDVASAGGATIGSLGPVS